MPSTYLSSNLKSAKMPLTIASVETDALCSNRAAFTSMHMHGCRIGCTRICFNPRLHLLHGEMGWMTLALLAPFVYK